MTTNPPPDGSVQKTDLDVLDQLTTFVRETTQAFFGAASRSDIETIVTERFQESELYESGRIVESLPEIVFVEHDSRGDGWTVSSRAITLTEALIETDDRPIEIPELADDVDGTVVFVSLESGRTVYGGLVIHSTRCDAFAERELAAIEWFGDTISQAINAVENRRLLFANAITELRIDCQDTPLQDLARDASCQLSLESFLPSHEDRIVAYCEVSGATADEINSVAASIEEIETARQVKSGDTRIHEFVLVDGSPLFAFVEGLANLRSAHIDETACTLIAEIASGTCAVPTLDRIHQECPRPTLIAKREHNLPPASLTTRVGPPEKSLESLTERQREVLEAAYHAGYFRWPRESTAEEVAESLGISSPTLHKHLRRAEEQLLNSLFG